MKIQEINHGYPEQPEKNTKAKRKNNKSKRKLKWLKLIIEFILVAATLVLLAISPLFNIREIEVYGSTHYNNEEIKSASGIIIGSNGFKTVGRDIKNLLTFRDGRAESNILKNCPYVKEVKAVFNVTGVIKIRITERKPIGIIHYLGTNLVVDDQAYVVDTIPDSNKSGLPLIKGLVFKQFKAGQALKLSKVSFFECAVPLIEAIKKDDTENAKIALNLMKRLDYIDVSDPENVTISVDSKLRVNFGDLQDLTYRIDFLKGIIISNDVKGYLDFSSGKNPYVVPIK